MLLSMLSLLLAPQADEVVMRISEARAATPWQEIFQASCGRRRLEIIRPMRPVDESPQVRLDGRTPRGDLSPLVAELGQARAAYRMSFRCSQDGAIHLRWVSGLREQAGPVRYRAGSATFHDGALTTIQAEDTTEEAFWYR